MQSEGAPIRRKEPLTTPPLTFTIMDLSALFSTTPGILSLSAGAFAIGWLLFGADNRVEDRRRRAADVARVLSSLGFKKLPLVFADYSIGDYSGMTRGIHELHDILIDPAQRQAELEQVFRLLIEEKLKDPDKLKVLQKLVDVAQAAFDSGEPLKASGDVAQQLLEVVKSGAVGGRLMTVQDSPLIPNLGALHKLLSQVLEKAQSAGNNPAAPAVAS